MDLLVLGYPQLTAEDQRFVDALRSRHDLPYLDVVKPHFTMVFPISNVPLSTFRDHIARVASQFRPVAFVCRYAMVHDDHATDDYYVFLVPDEGFSTLSLLHDALYTGSLASALRLDIPYVPHIGIATLKDPRRCKALADELNRAALAIGGMIEALSVAQYDGKVVTDVEHYRLGTNAA